MFLCSHLFPRAASPGYGARRGPVMRLIFPAATDRRAAATFVHVGTKSGALYLARSVLSPGPASGRTAVSSRTVAAGCGVAAVGGCAGSPAGIAIAAPPSPRSPSRRPTEPAIGAASAQPAASTAASDSPPAAAGGTAVVQVLALINQARSAARLPALT